VQTVPAPGLSAPRPLGRLAPILAAVAALAATASLVIPAPRAERPAAPAAATTPLATGVPLQRARCADWWAMDEGQRHALFRVLRGSVGAPSTGGGVGTTLTDAEATRLFDNNCANRVASGFLLYALYVRAAGFRVAPGTGI